METESYGQLEKMLTYSHMLSWLLCSGMFICLGCCMDALQVGAGGDCRVVVVVVVSSSSEDSSSKLQSEKDHAILDFFLALASIPLAKPAGHRKQRSIQLPQWMMLSLSGPME